jgi:hypothetical protein
MLCVPVFSLGAGADTFTLEWTTVDAGGGSDPLAQLAPWGSVGQPDAGATLRGSGFDLTGGFRPRVPAFDRDDLNCDRRVDFGDINPFVWLLTH